MNAREKICESVRDDLKAFLDGELRWLARRGVSNHLRSCGECSRVLEEIRSATQAVRSAGEIEAAPGMNERVLAQLRREGKMQATRAVTPLQKRLSVWYATGGAVVAAAVMIAVLYPMMGRAPERARRHLPIEPSALALDSKAVETTAEEEPAGPAAEPSGKQAPESKAARQRLAVGGETSPAPATYAETREEARDKGTASAAGEAGQPAAGGRIYEKKEGVATEELDKLNVTMSRGAPVEHERQVIRSAAVSLEVEDAARTLDKITALADSLGGFVQDSSVSKDSVSKDKAGPAHGRATIRVPSVYFDDAVNRVSELGKLLDKSTKGEDVTAQLVDLEARLKNLRAEEQQYVKILTKARKVSEILSVEYELGRIRGEIEQAEGQRAYLAKRVQLSTIAVVFSEKEEEKPQAPAGWNIGSTLKDSGQAFLSFARGLAKALIWIGVFCPVWFPVLLLFRYLYRVASGPVPVSDAGK